LIGQAANRAENVEKREARWGRLLRREQAATYLGVGANTFDRLVRAGEIPPPKRFTHAAITVWDINDLDACADSLPHDGAGHPDETWS
jgi:predicted DNA-binding transcriptional regulator AlpA